MTLLHWSKDRHLFGCRQGKLPYLHFSKYANFKISDKFRQHKAVKDYWENGKTITLLSLILMYVCSIQILITIIIKNESNLHSVVVVAQIYPNRICIVIQMWTFLPWSLVDPFPMMSHKNANYMVSGTFAIFLFRSHSQKNRWHAQELHISNTTNGGHRKILIICKQEIKNEYSCCCTLKFEYSN